MRSPCSDFAFPYQKYCFLIEVSLFPIRKCRRPIQISDFRIRKSDLRIRIPRSPVRKSRYRVGNSNFRIGRGDFRVGISHFPIRRSDSRVRNSHSRSGKSDIRTGIGQFTIGKSHPVGRPGEIPSLNGIVEPQVQDAQPRMTRTGASKKLLMAPLRVIRVIRGQDFDTDLFSQLPHSDCVARSKQHQDIQRQIVAGPKQQPDLEGYSCKDRNAFGQS